MLAERSINAVSDGDGYVHSKTQIGELKPNAGTMQVHKVVELTTNAMPCKGTRYTVEERKVNT